MMGKFFSPHPPLRLSNNAQIYDKNLKAVPSLESLLLQLPLPEIPTNPQNPQFPQ